MVHTVIVPGEPIVLVNSPRDIFIMDRSNAPAVCIPEGDRIRVPLRIARHPGLAQNGARIIEEAEHERPGELSPPGRALAGVVAGDAPAAGLVSMRGRRLSNGRGFPFPWLARSAGSAPVGRNRRRLGCVAAARAGGFFQCQSEE